MKEKGTTPGPLGVLRRWAQENDWTTPEEVSAALQVHWELEIDAAEAIGLLAIHGDSTAGEDAQALGVPAEALQAPADEPASASAVQVASAAVRGGPDGR